MENKHSDEASSDTLVKLLETMADYGAYAQLYFDYNQNDLANNGMGSELGDVTVSGYDKVISGTLQDGVSYLGSSLLLESEVVIRHYFSITDEAIVAGFNDSLGKSNWSELAPVGNGRYYTEQIVVAVELNDAKILELGGWSIQYSAMSYAQSMLDGGTTNEKLKNLLKALYLYSEAADVYFGR